MREAESLRYMTDTAGWRLVDVFIRERIADQKAQLMTCKNWEEVLEHRAGAKALESVLLFIKDTMSGEEDGDAEV